MFFMVAYWPTTVPCFECGTRFLSERELGELSLKIAREFNKAPSVGWAMPRQISYEVGLVKILTKRTRPAKNNPYVSEYLLKCYFCGKSTTEENYKNELQKRGYIQDSSSESVSQIFWKNPGIKNRVLLDVNLVRI